MTLETFYLFAAVAMLTTISIALNIKAGDNFFKGVSLVGVVLGLVGMCVLIGGALFGWDLPGAGV